MTDAEKIADLEKWKENSIAIRKLEWNRIQALEVALRVIGRGEGPLAEFARNTVGGLQPSSPPFSQEPPT